MSFTVEDIIRLRDGWRGPITVGELTAQVAAHIRVVTPHVYLSQESLAHINKFHSDVSDYDLLIAPFVIKHGLIIREVRKTKYPNQEAYLATYHGPLTPIRMGLTIKIAKPDREVYMTSFHPLHERQTKSWLARGEIIKTHD